ncbi:MAG: hypothetical protein TREMPRED_005726, partial [Tremellales sp. Tagirdzhanova-0007]
FDVNDDAEEDESEEQLDAPSVVPKKSKKKKSKKKKRPSASMTPALSDDASLPVTPSIQEPAKGAKTQKKGLDDPSAGMDEFDRALAEIKLKFGEESVTVGAGSSRGNEIASESKRFMTFRNLLSVDPKNLDADAELRRFFGSKVIASSAQSGPNRHRPTASSKLRYTISKAKPSYPPATSLAGLGMRELTADEIDEVYDRRELEMVDQGEKWFTFEHSGPWREIERQFLGAVRSHDPNELMALLQVYPWHVDTLLQMSEVYRLQSDIGAASDFAERALYAFDRCLIPAFNVLSGSSRLDFDRVENRPMFTALHRIISYLGRRGCWVTAFNFAKLLFALDPLGDPHGASFWLDFLAIKSNNGPWLLTILEQRETMPAAAALHAYPGIAYAKALALRAQEDVEKSKDRSKSDASLRVAMQTFPQVISILADKIGASLPAEARSHSSLQIEAGYTDTPSNVMHLLSHIYVARSEALWKEASNVSWFISQVTAVFPTINSSSAKSLQSDALAMMQISRDPLDETLNVPLFICRHVLCSESTSWLGFLPREVTSRPFNAHDPLPPTTAVTIYDAQYFNGVLRASARSPSTHPTNWQERINGILRDVIGARDFDGVPEGERANILENLNRVIAELRVSDVGHDGGGMPGGFPGAGGLGDADDLE